MWGEVIMLSSEATNGTVYTAGLSAVVKIVRDGCPVR